MADIGPSQPVDSYIFSMKPIQDFVLRYSDGSFQPKRIEGEERLQINAPLPSQPRLHELHHDEDWDQTFLYRGHWLPHLRTLGERIEAQYRTQSGYLLFVSSRDHTWFNSHLYVYYVPNDFSGAEWASIMTWETGEFFQPRWLILLSSGFYLRNLLEVGPQPLRYVEAVDDQTARFYVSRHGWYQLTLHEDPPQHFQPSHRSVHHENGFDTDARYFHIRKLRQKDLPPYPSIPEYRDHRFPLSNWQDWNAAIEKGCVGAVQQRAFAEVFAAEEGSMCGPLNAARTAEWQQESTDPNVETSHTPLSERTHDQLFQLYVAYFDELLADVGGAGALEDVGDELSACALADTLVDCGDPAPVKTVQRAINRLTTGRLPENGVFSAEHFAAYRKLSRDPARRNILLDALADDRRIRPNRDDERISRFQFRDVRGT